MMAEPGRHYGTPAPPSGGGAASDYKPAAFCPTCGRYSEPERGPGSPQSIRGHANGCSRLERAEAVREECDARWGFNTRLRPPPFVLVEQPSIGQPWLVAMDSIEAATDYVDGMHHSDGVPELLVDLDSGQRYVPTTTWTPQL